MKHKKILMLAIGVLLLISISGCQNATIPAPPPTQSANPTLLSPANPTEVSNPAPADQSNLTPTSYPAPADTGASLSAYPVPQDGSTIAWVDAEQMILKGQVTSIIQAQSLDLTITLTTGQTVKTAAPAADTVTTTISTCGDPCKNISVTTQ